MVATESPNKRKSPNKARDRKRLVSYPRTVAGSSAKSNQRSQRGNRGEAKIYRLSTLPLHVITDPGDLRVGALSEQPAFSPSLSRFFSSGLLLLVFFLPLFFGGVHDRTVLLAELFVFFSLSLVLFRGQESWKRVWDERPYFRLSVALLCAIPAFATLGFITHSFLPNLRPFDLPPRSPVQFLQNCRSLLFFIAAFSLSSFYCFTLPNYSRRVIQVVILASVFYSFVGISHWFSDNGKLFWVFEPVHIFPTNRARWPFVNANHLGHYLLSGFFLLLGLGLLRKEELTAYFSDELGRRRILIRSADFQEKLFSVMVLAASLLTVTVALLAVQSRGTWISLLFCITLFSAMRLGSRPKQAEKSNKRANGKRIGLFHLREVRLLFRWMPVLFVFGAAVFLVQGEGSERIEQRILYGLNASKDDTRWTLYEQSIPYLFQAPFLGVGLGGWSEIFEAKKPESLADVTPLYLHSDPLQILVEVGFLGALPLILLSGFFIAWGLRNFDRSGPLQMPLFFGIAAVVLASFVDFPFRIPAISLQFAVLLAVFVASLPLPNVVGRR